MEIGERLGQRVSIQRSLSTEYERLQKQRDEIQRQLVQIYEEFLRVSGEIRVLRELERDDKPVDSPSAGQVSPGDSPVSN